MGDVVEPVAAVKPPVESTAEIARHAVGVAIKTKRTDQRFLLVGFAVAVGVAEIGDVGDGVGDAAFAVGIDADGDVEVVGEGGDFPGVTAIVEIIEDHDAIHRVFAILGGKGIGIGDGDPESTFGVEGDVEWLADVGFAGDELNLETGRQVE